MTKMRRYSDRVLGSCLDCASGLCAASEVGTPRGGSIRIQHVTAAAAAVAASGGGTGAGMTSVPGAAGACLVGEDGPARFPRLDECAHFHYDHVELGPLQVRLYEEELKPLSEEVVPEEGGGVPWCVQVQSQGRAWLLRRNYRDFCSLDQQLHRCIYDRKFSALPELPDQPSPEDGETSEECTRRLLSQYLGRFSHVAGSLINCGPVLNWLELDNRGHRLIVTEDNAINTPAVAAAYAIRRYTAQAADEISFEVGDMISVIDMPPPEESIWWRGKRGFEVGFFPCDTVAVIGEKVPKNLHLTAAPPPASITAGPNAVQPNSVVVHQQAVSAPTSAAPHSIVSAPLAAASPLNSALQQPSKPVLRKHGKLIAFFRSFILNRPSRRRLKQSGILKERVFGCDLGEHLLNSGHEIPMVLKCCAEFIESCGIVDGIYRLSGVTSNIQKLRNAFDEDRIPALYEDEAILQDIHSVASLLKMYFRELPNPLCTYQLYHQFVAAVQSQETARIHKMREAVQKLPPPHYRTLEYLIKHLARVASRGHSTGMTPRNVAIVWAPNLLRCKELEVGGVAALQGVGVQAVVTEYLVCCADLIFCDKLPDAPKTPPISEQAVSTLRRNRPKSLAISTPTKLLSLEEARTRALGRTDQEYIEVGGGPSKLPEKYHTVIELPIGGRKRVSSLKAKRSPLGWRSFFGGKARASSARPGKGRKANTPTEMDKAIAESEILQAMRPLRPVKSAESLGSGGASAANSARNSAALDLEIPAGSPDSPSVAGPLPTIMVQTSFLSSAKPSHNRSVSHDSYFDLLSQAQEGDEDGESLDLSEIQLNFELEESEMRIFSEDETLVSTSAGSPSISVSSTFSHKHKSVTHASPRTLRSRPDVPRARPEDTSSADPSPKKKKSGSNSPSSRKRSKLEERLARTVPVTPHSVEVEELRYIDSQSPEPACTTVVHAEIHESPPSDTSVSAAGATASENESFTLHSSGSSGLTTPSSPPCYAPLLSDNDQPSPLTASTTPAERTPSDNAMSLEGLYENLATGDWQHYEPIATSRVYQNLVPAVTDENLYEDVQLRSSEPTSITPQNPQNSDPEVVYQQVKAFRRSVAEVNDLMQMEELRATSSPPHSSMQDADDLRRRFDSEIGRDIVRDRRMRMELEKMRADSSPCHSLGGNSNVDRASSEVKMVSSPPSSLTCLSAASGELSPQTTAAPLLPETTEGSLTSLSSATSSGLEPLSPSSPPSRSLGTSSYPIMSPVHIALHSPAPAAKVSPMHVNNLSISPRPKSLPTSPDKGLLSPTSDKESSRSLSTELSSQRIPNAPSSITSSSPNSPNRTSPNLDTSKALDSPRDLSPISNRTSVTSLDRLQDTPTSIDLMQNSPTSSQLSPDITTSPQTSQAQETSHRPAPPSYPTTPTSPLPGSLGNNCSSRSTPRSSLRSSPDQRGSDMDEPRSASTQTSPISPEPEPWLHGSSPKRLSSQTSPMSPELEQWLPESPMCSPQHSQNEPVSPTSEDVELRQHDSSDANRPSSAPATGKPGTIRFHLTLTSRRSSEPVKQFSVADSRRLADRKASVKELLNRFEGNSVHRSMPPCLRARAARGQLASSMSTSLDEDRFNEHARELVRVQTSPDVAIQDEESKDENNDSKPTASAAKLDLARNLLTSVNLDDPERRERIERYKEERRCFLREKYRSESFRGEKDDIVVRLKQKTTRPAPTEEPMQSMIPRSASANERLGSVVETRKRSQSESSQGSSSSPRRHPTSPTRCLGDMGAVLEVSRETDNASPGLSQYFSSV